MGKWEAVKSEIVKASFALVEQRISTAQELLRAATEAAQAEEKSTAGDKYETARAMAQIEQEKAGHQLSEAFKLKQELTRVSGYKSTGSQVRTGSLIITDHHHFFVAVSLGKIKVADADFFVVAPATPIARSLLGLQVGAQFLFNQQVLTIKEIL